jgi:hypothetical protein
MNFEDEIDTLESTLSFLESAMREVAESPYHGHLYNTWELDATDIKSRLEELYEIQNKQWEEENKQEENEYWGAVI